MATLFVSGIAGQNLWDTSANTFDFENLPAALFLGNYGVVEDAFDNKTYTGAIVTASTLSANVIAPGSDPFVSAVGVLGMAGTGFTGSSGTIKRIEYAQGEDRWAIVCNAKWSDARGGIYSGTISSIETVSGDSSVRMAGSLSWDGAGFAGTLKTLQITVGGLTLEVIGSFNSAFTAGTVTALNLSDESGNTFSLQGSFGAAAFFSGFQDAVDSGLPVSGFLSASGFLDGLGIVSGGDMVLPGGFDNLRLSGAGNANATGNADDNILTGNDGDNTLDGGAGADAMAGGNGNDTFVVDDAGDVVSDSRGIDTVRSSVSFTLGRGLENLVLTGVENINGTGSTSANTLAGNGGDNTLDGQRGIDTMAGGLGSDAYVVDNAQDMVIENPGEGDGDTVYSSVTYALPDNVENLVLTGTRGGLGTGSALDNTLIGNNGANTLDGGAGADTLRGGLGKDTYIVDDENDVVIEDSALATEIDHVKSAVSFTLGGNLENLTLTAAGNTGTGNALGNTLTGSAGDDTLNGLGGNDKIYGGVGHDTLDGGMGSDTVAGGDGNDTVILDLRTDVFVAGVRLDKDAFDGGAGDDTLVIRLTYAQSQDAAFMAAIDAVQAAINAGNTRAFTSLPLGLKITSFAALKVVVDPPPNRAPSGITLDNAIVDENAAGAVVGNLAVTDPDAGDTHILTVDDARFEIAGGQLKLKDGQALDFETEPSVTVRVTAEDEGGLSFHKDFIIAVNDQRDPLFTESGDTIDFEALAAGSYLAATYYNALGGNDMVTLPSAGTAPGIGYDAANVFFAGAGDDVVNGNDLNDSISGGAGRDTLYGGVGNDTLTGDDGDDTLDGGAGDDTLDGGIGSDTVSYASASGSVWANLSLGTANTGIAAGIDTWIGIENIIGSAFNDTLEGDNFDNIMYGGDGYDRLYGLGGDDTLDGGAGGGELYGYSGNDVLYGGSGNDNIDGGDGDDTVVYAGAASGVTLDFNNTGWQNTGGAGWDRVVGVEDIVGSSFNDALTGNFLENVIEGSAGDDYIDGDSGDDVLYGGDGNDVLAGGLGADTFLFRAGEAGVDTIADFSLAEGDILDIGGLLSAYTPGVDDLADFVTIADDGTDSALFVDADGAGAGAGMTQIAVIFGITGLDAAQMVIDGNLVVA